MIIPIAAVVSICCGILSDHTEASAATESVAECVVEASSKRFLHTKIEECTLAVASRARGVAGRRGRKVPAYIFVRERF